MSSNLTLRKYSRIFTRPELPYFLIIWSTVFLCALGLTMVLSASTVKSLQESGNTYSIFIRQFFFLILGAMATYWAYRVQGGIWQRIAKISLSISIVILLLPFIPNLGKNINGNRNWIEILGFTLQPSEFAKFGLILWCALQLRNIDVSIKGKNPFIAILPGLVIIEGLILMERDLGTALLILLIFAGILFTTGAPIKHFIIVAALGVIVGGAFIISSSYRVSRFGALFNPFDERYYKFSGWQPAHSIMGLASGGLWGSGLGGSKQKWANLAEAHTDFIFAVIGEELGLFGTLATLLLLSILIFSIFKLALRAHDPMVRYVASGFGCWIAIQTILNIGSAISVLPVVGVTLPLVSYGGSALIATYMGIGFVLGAARRDPAIYKELQESGIKWLR